jgi:uncharacterized damage-inducible protein DinB
MTEPEPWLRGPLAGVHPLLAPPLYTLQQVREELAACTAGLSPEEIWARPHGLTPLGFHLRHIAGSTDRLSAYLRGEPLSDGLLAAMRRESEPGASRDELLAEVGAALDRAEALIRALDPATLTEARTVGRKALPTTVVGLVFHIAEHAFRHLGQAVSAARLVRAAGTLS